MAKIEKEIPNPGTGGTYLFDPKTGKTTLVPETTDSSTTQDNGTVNQKDLASSQD